MISEGSCDTDKDWNNDAKNVALPFQKHTNHIVLN